MSIRGFHPDPTSETYENQVMGALSGLSSRPTVDEVLGLFPKFWEDEYRGAVRRLVLSGRLTMDQESRLG